MLKIDEKNLEDIIYENLLTTDGTQLLSERGLDLNRWEYSKILRQVNLADYGIADIVVISLKPQHAHITIIELKVTEFNVANIIQVGRYNSAISAIMSKLSTRRLYFEIESIIICSSFNSDNEYVWLDRVINCSVYKTNYNIDGLFFQKVLPSNWFIDKASRKPSDYFNMRMLKELYKQTYRASNIKKSAETVEELPF